MEEHFDEIYKISKKHRNPVNTLDNRMLQANNHFEDLRRCMNGDMIGDVNALMERYIVSRKAVTREAYVKESSKWNKLIADNDSKKLWKKIDWKGNISNQTSQGPMIDDLKTHFQNLHKDDGSDLEKISELQSEVYIPILDDPIYPRS